MRKKKSCSSLIPLYGNVITVLVFILMHKKSLYFRTLWGTQNTRSLQLSKSPTQSGQKMTRNEGKSRRSDSGERGRPRARRRPSRRERRTIVPASPRPAGGPKRTQRVSFKETAARLEIIPYQLRVILRFAVRRNYCAATEAAGAHQVHGDGLELTLHTPLPKPRSRNLPGVY